MNKKIKKISITVVIVIIALYIMGPFLWTFLSSIKGEKDLYSGVLEFNIKSLTFNRYLGILFAKEISTDSNSQTLQAFRNSLLNSFVVGLAVTIICLFIGALSAFVFAKNKSKGRNIIFSIIVSFIFIPIFVLALPFFIIIAKIGLLDSKLGLIIVHTSITLPIVIWIIKSFFETIPNEILDAAKIDGCSGFRLFLRIIIPISTPAFATAGVMAFISSWQEFLFALVITSSNSSKTIPVAMAEFFGRAGFNYGMASAGVILVTIPIVIIAFIIQRYIIGGLLTGSVVG